MCEYFHHQTRGVRYIFWNESCGRGVHCSFSRFQRRFRYPWPLRSKEFERRLVRVPQSFVAKTQRWKKTPFSRRETDIFCGIHGRNPEVSLPLDLRLQRNRRASLPTTRRSRFTHVYHFHRVSEPTPKLKRASEPRVA